MVGSSAGALSRFQTDRSVQLRRLVEAALAGVDPVFLLDRALASSSGSTSIAQFDRFSLLAAGKAAEPMARYALDRFGDRVRRGLIVAPRIEGSYPAGIAAHAGGHPLPTPESVRAGSHALEIARACSAAEPLVVLLSGGASALLAAPATGLDLAGKIEATSLLLRAGVDIHGLNAVRKHLSAIKGGRLAALAGGSLTFALSDVVAPIPDDPSVIGSGPTVADPTTFEEALAVVERAGVLPRFPPAARRVLAEGAAGGRAETPKPGSPELAGADYRLIGGRLDAIAAAAERANAMGFHVLRHDPPIIGEARSAAESHAAFIRQIAKDRPRPLCVLSAGETTVTVKGSGKGGRNQEFALSFAMSLAEGGGFEPYWLASLGTDGIDGPTDAAGALVDGETLSRARDAGLDASSYLDRNDSYHLFERLGDLIRTGPTGTNVGDIQVVLIGNEEL